MTTSDALPQARGVPPVLGTDVFESMLRAASLRVTRPRLAVLGAVRSLSLIHI